MSFPAAHWPDSVLYRIFQLGSSGPGYRGLTPFPVTVSHVARRWRDISLQAQSIWTRIRLTGEEPPAQVSAYLTRSRQALLDVIIDSELLYDEEDNEKEPNQFCSILDSVLLHVHRWKTLSIFVSCEDLLGEILSRLNALEVLHLWEMRSLQIYLPLQNGSGSRWRYPASFVSGATRLSTLRLTQCLADNFAVPNLKEFFYCFRKDAYFDELFFPYEPMFELARHSRLVKLTLCDVTLTGDFSEGSRGCLKMPYLEHLVTDGGDVSSILWAIDASSLTTLEVYVNGTAEIAEVVAVIQPSEGAIDFPNVQNLTLGARCNSEPVEMPVMKGRFSHGFPSLRHLSISHINPHPLLRLLSRPINPSPLRWPNLMTLALTQIDVEDEGLLRDTVGYRAELRPLTCLRLARSVRLAYGLVEYLHQHLQVESFDLPLGDPFDDLESKEYGPCRPLPLEKY